jgi:predicted RNase H-like HicB family nuclease
MKPKFVVVFEQGPRNYSAYVPDLPGCVSTGKTWEEMQEMILEAITGHIEVMLEFGDPLPERHMTMEEAMVYHSEPLTEEELASWVEFDDGSPTLSVTFKEIEVEVPASSPVPID